jgi:TrmH family RNA methyltransferase
MKKELHRLKTLLRDYPDTKNKTAQKIRACSNLRNGILQLLGSEPADWDLSADDPYTSALQSDKVLPVRLFLEDIRAPFNVGAIFRCAEAFNIEKIYLSPACPTPLHPRAQRAAMGCVDLVAWEVLQLEELPSFSAVVALETGGTPLDRFQFPSGGLVIIGSEELGLSPQALALADGRNGRVTIPMHGAKSSLNVAVATGILLYSWANSLNCR